jgi:hypothetical protein
MRGVGDEESSSLWRLVVIYLFNFFTRASPLAAFHVPPLLRLIMCFCVILTDGVVLCHVFTSASALSPAPRLLFKSSFFSYSLPRNRSDNWIKIAT